MTRMTGTVCADVCTFMIVSGWNFLRMRKVSDKSCRENQNTHIIFQNSFPKNVRFMR